MPGYLVTHFKAISGSMLLRGNPYLTRC